MAQALLEAILRGYSWPVLQAVRNAYDSVSGHASSKSALTRFEGEDGEPSWSQKTFAAMEEGHSEKYG